MSEFVACEGCGGCAAKPGELLCPACRANRATIERLEKRMRVLVAKCDSPSVCLSEDCQYESWAYCPHCGEAT